MARSSRGYPLLDHTSPISALGLSPITYAFVTADPTLFPDVGHLAAAGALVGELEGMTGARVTEVAQKLAAAGYPLGSPLPVQDPDPPPVDPAAALVYWQNQAGRALEVLVCILKATPGGAITVPSCVADAAATRRVILTALPSGGFTVSLGP